MGSTDRSFLFRVRDALDDLHPAERRLGEFVCDFPGELASYSASDLARLAQVSNATVTRFVRRLGYEQDIVFRRPFILYRLHGKGMPQRCPDSTEFSRNDFG